MPNYVYNQIAVKRKEADKAKALLEKGIAETLLPMPEHLVGTKYPGDSENWYEWCLLHWGTKWGDFDLEWSDSDYSLRFTTAWSPFNDELIELILEYFNGNMIYWWEEEQGFGAENEWKDFASVSFREWDEKPSGRTYND
jgi:hypothetical protein